MILLYDNDEKIAPGAATTLVQRGYDNIFMLSGGKNVSCTHKFNALMSLLQDTAVGSLTLWHDVLALSFSVV